MTRDPLDAIVQDPEVLHGQARIRGSRIAVSVLLDCMAAGLSDEEMLRHYPTLERDDLRAASAYGAALAREELLALPS